MSAFSPVRYPYTYSADFMRNITEHLTLSRGEAARILSVLSEVVGFDREAAAYALADAYLTEWHPECLAQAIEARRAETAKQGSVEDESAVPQGCAQGEAP